MNWIILIVLIAALMYFFKMKRVKHRVSWIITVALILFIYVTIAYSTSGEEIDWRTIEGMRTGTKTYLSWLAGTLDNVKEITANAINLDWSKDNSRKIRIFDRT